MSRDLLAKDVSRETFLRLERYTEILTQWNPKINLVSRSTIPEVWERHLADSAQIFDLAPDFCKWLDLGSGGGFPGLVVAIYAAEFRPEASVTLVEADQRKCAFLRTVARETGVQVTILNKRIEDVPAQGVDIVSARALASLDDLLHYAKTQLGPDGIAIFPKGARWKAEVEEAEHHWRFRYEACQSKTDLEAVVLKIGEIVRV